MLYVFVMGLVRQSKWSKRVPHKLWPRTLGSSCEIAVSANSWYSEQNGSVDEAFNSSQRANNRVPQERLCNSPSMFTYASKSQCLTRSIQPLEQSETLVELRVESCGRG